MKRQIHADENFVGKFHQKAKYPVESKEERFQKKKIWKKKYHLRNVPMAKNFDTVA